MALVSMRELLDHAATHNYAIPAFNVNNLEQVQAVMTAADEVGAPVILQASAGARKYAGEPFIKHLIQAATEQWPHIPLVMHQDHGQSPDVSQGAIDLGFSSVMMDGSLEKDGKTIASYEYNVEVTKKVVAMAHATGVTVEGELGCLGSLETGTAGEEDGVGAEGTLGVITGLDLRLHPVPPHRVTAVAGFDDLDALIATGRRLRDTDGIAALELIDARAGALTAEHLGVHAAVGGAWQLLVEMAGDTDQSDLLASVLSDAELTGEPAVGIDAEHLHIEAGSPLLRERRTSRDQFGTAFEYADDRYRPDVVAFSIVNARTIDARP